MTPLLTLETGLSALLACGVPTLRHARAQIRRGKHLEARLEALRPSADLVEALAQPNRQGAVNAEFIPRWLRIALARADMTLDWRTTVIVVSGSLLAAALLVTTCGPLYGAALLAGMALVMGVTFRIVTHRRLANFVGGLPAYLDSTRQLIMVGNSLQQAMVMAGDFCVPGVARHIAPLLRRIQFGAPPAESILWLAARIDVTELHMLAAAVQTNVRYGGRISNVLASLTNTLRDRARIGRELRSATAETRMSGVVLSGLPVCVAGFIAVFNPTYMGFFVNTHQGRTLLLMAIALEISGIVVMRRIMRIRF